MKQLFTLSFVLLLSLAAGAQDLHCATDKALERAYRLRPEKKIMKQQLLRQSQVRANKTMAANYVIPVVFHIMHLGGPENVSDAQIIDAVRILNRDFAKLNPDTTEIIPEFKNLADSAGIRFVLATRDPMGNCTNGIIHHYSTDTDWDDTSPTLYAQTWDPTMYMNVYIVRSITLSGGFPAAGYTYYPGTWAPGDPWDAIVVLNNYTGSIGTSIPFLSRVLTHEVGHWLDLAHVFGYFQTAGINCMDDDYVMDTPTTIGHLSCPNPAIPSQYQTCTPGVSENFQNYMDYSYCCRMFTTGQCQRMQNALQDNISGRDNLGTNSNLLATGVINPTVPCVPVADFKYSREKTCAGTPVTFADASMNATVTGHSWTFAGGTPATSTASAPVVVYTTPGLYSVTYVSSNSAGSSAPVTKNSIINVTGTTAQYLNNWTEGFESPAVFSNDWLIASSSGSGKWERTGLASATGANCVRINRLGNTRKNSSWMTGPSVNISSVPAPMLSFKVASAESVPNHTNVLNVYASTDCGSTWSLIYSKGSAALITTNATPADFIPASASAWRTELVSLSSLGAAAYVNFKFQYVRDTVPSGNNIYIDDINIISTTALPGQAEQLQYLSLYPNPSKGSVQVAFSLLSPQKVTFTLSDVLGRKLELLAEKEFAAGDNNQQLDLQPGEPGVYFLKMEMNGAAYTRKLLIE